MAFLEKLYSEVAQSYMKYLVAGSKVELTLADDGSVGYNTDWTIGQASATLSAQCDATLYGENRLVLITYDGPPPLSPASCIPVEARGGACMDPKYPIFAQVIISEGRRALSTVTELCLATITGFHTYCAVLAAHRATFSTPLPVSEWTADATFLDASASHPTPIVLLDPPLLLLAASGHAVKVTLVKTPYHLAVRHTPQSWTNFQVNALLSEQARLHRMYTTADYGFLEALHAEEKQAWVAERFKSCMSLLDAPTSAAGMAEVQHVLECRHQELKLSAIATGYNAMVRRVFNHHGCASFACYCDLLSDGGLKISMEAGPQQNVNVLQPIWDTVEVLICMAHYGGSITEEDDCSVLLEELEALEERLVETAKAAIADHHVNGDIQDNKQTTHAQISPQHNQSTDDEEHSAAAYIKRCQTLVNQVRGGVDWSSYADDLPIHILAEQIGPRGHDTIGIECNPSRLIRLSMSTTQFDVVCVDYDPITAGIAGDQLQMLYESDVCRKSSDLGELRPLVDRR